MNHLVRTLGYVKMVPVASTSIAAIGYENDTLDVAFATGPLYRYFGVPTAVHDDFLRAPSKGRYFSQFVRSRYGFTRLR